MQTDEQAHLKPHSLIDIYLLTIYHKPYLMIDYIIIPLLLLRRLECVLEPTKRIDNLITEKQTFIKLLKEKRQALISHGITKGLDPNVKIKDSGVDWVGEVSEHWVVKKIKYDFSKIEQGWSPQCESTPVINGESWVVVKVGCVNGGIFNSMAQEGYPMLMLCDKIYRIKLDFQKVDPNFVAYYLGSDKAREQIEIDAIGTSSSMLNIGQGTIFDMPTPMLALNEQLDIIDYLNSNVNKIQCLMQETQSSVNFLLEHRTALISAAVTGKIDVRSQVLTSPDRPQPQESAHA